MSTLAYVLFLIVAFTGSFIQSICGFGCAIVTMSVFPYFMPGYQMSVTVSSLLALSSNVGNLVTRLKSVRIKLIIPPLIGYFIFSAIAIVYSIGKADAALKAVLGAVLILLSLYFMFIKNKIKIKPTFINGLIAGCLSGILGGIFSIGGPPLVVYTLAVTGSKEEYFATNMAFFTITNIYTAIIRAMKGLITSQIIFLWLIGSVMIFIGVFSGKKIVDKLNAQTMRKIIYIFMALSGCIMVVDLFI
jgi:uncharacterized membrane protein YfcA